MKYFFITLIIIFLYYQYKFINNISTDIEIKQANNPEKDTFETILSDKNPSVFTNILIDVNLTKRNIKSYFNYYLPPFCINYNFEVIQEVKNSKTILKIQENYRLLIYQLKGTQNIILFSPKEIKYLYPKYNKKESNINFWKYDPMVYPEFNKSSYLEIILRPRQMLYIPYKWWYTSKVSENSNVLICKSETIFSKLLKNKN